MIISYHKLWVKLESKHISKQELIKLLHMHPATLGRLETNQKVCHTVLNKLANFFECQPADLMEKQKE